MSDRDLRIHVDLPASRAVPGLGALNGKSGPIIATGHQAWHWHPGIYAKYVAAAALAQHRGGRVLNIIVDQDVYDPLRLELPVRESGRGDRLGTRIVQLGRCDLQVPPGCQTSVNAGLVVEALERAGKELGPALAVDLSRLREAWAQHGEPSSPESSLADQVWQVLRSMLPAVHESMPASRLLLTPQGRDAVAHMLADGPRCVRLYNEAVAAHPQAGLAPLRIEPDRIELPLWLLRWGKPRQRVFVDVADREPLLVDEAGETVSWGEEDDAFVGRLGKSSHRLAPRALLLTALVRAHLCDLFIHGLGGGQYEKATDAWWPAFSGQALAPIAVVSADLHLPFDVPLADAGDLRRAVWFAHHLPHNVERYSAPSAAIEQQVSRKRELLSRMDGDRDRPRRAAAFAELHRINATMAQAQPGLIEQSREAVEQARAGVANAAVAGRRDWCFALYPPQALERLGEKVRQRAAAAASQGNGEGRA